MTVATLTLEAVLERLERLERQHRRRGRVGAAALVVTAAAILLAGRGLFPWRRPGDEPPRRTERVVEAERFVLRDLAGAIQAELAVEPHGSASLSLFDRDGNRRVRLSAWGFYLADPGGKERASLRLIPGVLSSDASVPVLHLADAEGKPRTTLMVLPDGSSRLLLSDREGKGGASMLTEADGAARLAVFDRDGRNAAWLGTLPDGSPSLFMTDQAEQATVMMGVAADGAPHLVFADKDHQERAVLALLPDGTPNLELSGKDSHGGANLGVTPSGAPVLDLFDQEGRAGAVLVTTHGSSGLLIRDQDGKQIAGLETEAGRWPRLSLSGNGVNLGTLLTVAPDGAPGLALYDAHGKPRAVLGQLLLGKAARTPPAHKRMPFSLMFVDRKGKVTRRVGQ